MLPGARQLERRGFCFVLAQTSGKAVGKNAARSRYAEKDGLDERLEDTWRVIR